MQLLMYVHNMFLVSAFVYETVSFFSSLPHFTPNLLYVEIAFSRMRLNQVLSLV